MTKKIGILTAGSDCPGINATIRGFGKAAKLNFDMELVGFKDGFRGLISNQLVDLSGDSLSNVLTAGGTILGTSREVPHMVKAGSDIVDKTQDAVAVYKEHNLDGLVCIGGTETQEAGFHLQQAGLNVITLPKSADNDVPLTDVTIGFDTATDIATEAIDRLHSTASSNHRIIIIEIMGREVGWLTLGAGIAAGADVILIPEIPYQIEIVTAAIKERQSSGKNFSIVAVAEGAYSAELEAFFNRSIKINRNVHHQESAESGKEKMTQLKKRYSGETLLLANRLEETTGIECRITILGHLLRGGSPSASDRILATQLGTRAASLVDVGEFGVMVAFQNGETVCVALGEVIAGDKLVQMDHPWIVGARQVGTILGD